MPVSLPYLASNKNLPVLFEKIGSAKIPDTFSYSFLQSTIGLKGSNDRAFITLLRNLGFLDQTNSPTAKYRRLKGEGRRVAIADGTKDAYASLFDADQSANKLSSEKLKSLVAQVAGTDDAMTSRIANTFNALCKLGDFESIASPELGEEADEEGAALDRPKVRPKSSATSSTLRTEFHYNIQIHLPSNGTEDVYLNIFNALRKTFQ